MLEKLGYVAAIAVLYLQGRVGPLQLATGGPDALLGVVFLFAFFKTRRLSAPMAHLP